MAGLNGIFSGSGQILAGLVFGFWGKKTNKYGIYPAVLIGTIMVLTAFVLTGLNLPNDAPFGDTQSQAVIKPSNEILAMANAFILGFGFGCYNTQCLAILGILYRDNSGPAFSIYNMVKSLSAAISFFYSSYVPLYYQLGLMTVLGIIGTITFVIVDRNEMQNVKHLMETE